jgi:hypothetical protein
LIAFNLGIPQERDFTKIVEIANSVKVAPFVPKRISTEEDGVSKKSQESPEDEEVIKAIA